MTSKYVHPDGLEAKEVPDNLVMTQEQYSKLLSANVAKPEENKPPVLPAPEEKPIGWDVNYILKLMFDQCASGGQCNRKECAPCATRLHLTEMTLGMKVTDRVVDVTHFISKLREGKKKIALTKILQLYMCAITFARRAIKEERMFTSPEKIELADWAWDKFIIPEITDKMNKDPTRDVLAVIQEIEKLIYLFETIFSLINGKTTKGEFDSYFASLYDSYHTIELATCYGPVYKEDEYEDEMVWVNGYNELTRRFQEELATVQEQMKNPPHPTDDDEEEEDEGTAVDTTTESVEPTTVETEQKEPDGEAPEDGNTDTSSVQHDEPENKEQPESEGEVPPETDNGSVCV